VDLDGVSPLDGVGMRILTEAECYQRLGAVRVGRVALSWRAMPLILPVHYGLLDRAIVIHTTVGTTLDRATDGTVVGFEAEGPAGAAEPSWSVVTHGMATHRTPPPPVDPGRIVEIVLRAGEVTGREVLDTADPLLPYNPVALPRW
jgi:hypothetical protein